MKHRDGKVSEPKIAFWTRFIDPLHLAVLLNSLVVLLRAGIILGRALEIAAEQEIQPRLKAVLRGVVIGVTSRGEPLSVAASSYPAIFPAPLLLLIKAGEEAGDLPGRLDQGRRLIEREVQLTRGLRAALVGPCLTLMACVAMLYVLLLFVLPRIVELYDGLRLPLPWISKVILDVARFACHPVATAAGVVLLLVAARQWKWIQVRLLVLGLRFKATRRMVGQILATTFCDIVGHLYADGVSLSTAVGLLAQQTNIPPYARLLEEVNRRFQNTGDLAAALTPLDFFPRSVQAVLYIGQETGQIDVMLFSIGQMLDEDNQLLFDRLLTLIEPIMMAIMGLLLTFLFIGMFAPIYGLLSHLD